MAHVTRKIGLSLGADLCWPICYEAILQRLDLAIPVGGDTVRFDVERVTIEPFDLRQDVRYDVVIDRLTHWYDTSREWIKKGVLMNDLYVFNNPWSVQSMEKHSSYCAMMRLGFPIPETWMLPPKRYEALPDLQVTLERYAKLFDLSQIGERVGYPLFMKPYDGGAWANVTRVGDDADLKAAYDESGTRVMHLQHGVDPYEAFVRCVGLGPQTRCIKYDPSAPLHGRYTMERDFLSAEDESELRDMTLTINSFFGWDFNSCEALLRDRVWYPIDFANPCPDSQVTSLHYHFPWLIMANLRWSLFCAATKRPMRINLDFAPYYDVARKDWSFRDKLTAYARIARERLEADRFEEFCAQHLGHLEQVTWEFFATDQAMDAVRQKVAALYPRHEIEIFTTLFWNRIQHWRESAPAAGADRTPDPERESDVATRANISANPPDATSEVKSPMEATAAPSKPRRAAPPKSDGKRAPAKPASSKPRRRSGGETARPSP